MVKMSPALQDAGDAVAPAVARERCARLDAPLTSGVPPWVPTVRPATSWSIDHFMPMTVPIFPSLYCFSSSELLWKRPFSRIDNGRLARGIHNAGELVIRRHAVLERNGPCP
jgi:hypothetical protein